MNATLIVWLALCLIWGSTWLFIKLGLRDRPIAEGDLNPIHPHS